MGAEKSKRFIRKKGVPKATTQDSCFSHMICEGQSLREQPREVLG